MELVLFNIYTNQSNMLHTVHFDFHPFEIIDDSFISKAIVNLYAGCHNILSSGSGQQH